MRLRLDFASLLVAVLLVLLGLTSCGGDSAPLSADDYLTAGNNLCSEWSDKIAELDAGLPANASQDDLREFSIEAGRLADDFTERLLDLAAPESLLQGRSALVDRLDQYDQLIAAVPETEEELDAITDAGNAVSDALADLWSACRR